jgi:hypothetical protein
MAEIENLRWSVDSNDFATRLVIPDLKGVFRFGPLELPKQRSLVIEAGTRALVVDEGCLVGEVSPGSYVLETFLERLQFWRERQVTVVLARQEDVALQLALKVPTAEFLTVDAKVRLTVQIEDIAAFLENLLGAQERLLIKHVENSTHRSVSELVSPLVRQALWGAIRSVSIKDLMTPGVQQQMSDTVTDAVCSSLKRYGLRFVEVQMVHIEHEDHDALAERSGDRWIEDEEKRLQILRLETESELARDEVDKRLQRNSVRRELMSALNAGKMDGVNSEEEMRQFVLDIDRQKLLRREERDQLVFDYETNKQDRGIARQHGLKLLQLEQRLELENARVDLDHAVAARAIEHEIELSQLTHSKRNQDWQQKLQLERDRLQSARDERRKARDFKWDELRRDGVNRREEQTEQALQTQRLDAIADEIRISRRERKNRVAMLEIELKAHLEEQNLELTKRRKEWELEHANQKSDSQIDRMRRVQDMNLDFDHRRKQNELDLELLKDDRSHARELERIQAMGSLSAEAMIATANEGNAALLADLKKQEHLTKSKLETAEALNEERLRLYDKLNDTERAKADAYQRAMQSQKELASDVSAAKKATVVAGGLGGLGGVVAVPGASSVAADAARTGSPPPLTEAPTWHVAIGGQQAGPLTPSQVRQQIAAGSVNSATLTWCAGMSGWEPIGQVPAWSSSFSVPTTPPPL